MLSIFYYVCNRAGLRGCKNACSVFWPRFRRRRLNQGFVVSCLCEWRESAVTLSRRQCGFGVDWVAVVCMQCVCVWDVSSYDGSLHLAIVWVVMMCVGSLVCVVTEESAGGPGGPWLKSHRQLAMQGVLLGEGARTWSQCSKWDSMRRWDSNWHVGWKR